MRAFAILTVPIVEIRMPNIHARRAFRHHSGSPRSRGQICGFA
jgi:3-dehydroquinate dehydratase